MSASTRYALVSLVAFSWLAAGCGSSKKTDLGGGCTLNSDCNSPLLCTFGKCHTACVQTSDCPLGQSCVMAAGGSVCQLPTEADCRTTTCEIGTVCAVDYHCRTVCQSPTDCTPLQACVSNVCADPTDLDPTGQLPPKVDSGVDACPTGSETCACYPNDTCNAGLTCASHLCVRLGGTGGNLGSGDGGGGVSGGAGTTGAGGNTGTAGYGISGQSCKGMTGTECNGESCCTSLLVPGGTFPMGRGTETCSDCTDGCPGGMTCYSRETPEHRVTVSPFSLDKYEVTLGRFRRFVDAYDGINAPPPADGGGNPNIPGTGWQAAWNANLPADSATFQKALKCDSSHQTWMDLTGNTEVSPINCVNWYEAFAFCLWDGGRLPTEAEWEYAAAGGDQNRLYPWGSSPPSCSLANGSGCVGNLVTVGSYPSGQGRWGHMDLAGNVWESVFDWYQETWYSSSLAGVTDPAETTSSPYRVQRGGSVGGPNEDPSYLRVVFRTYATPPGRYYYVGLRCARNP
jgi:sulfatase modifying factor 1